MTALDPGEGKVREGVLQKKFPEQAGLRKYGRQEGRVKDTSRTGAVCSVRAKAKCLAGAKDTCRGGRVMRLGRGWRHEAPGAKLRPPQGSSEDSDLSHPLQEPRTRALGVWGDRSTQCRLPSFTQRPLLLPFNSIIKA